MYPCYCDYKSFETPETRAFENDCDLIGDNVINGNDRKITKEWAERFKKHLDKLRPLAEASNPRAQYDVAVIFIIGYCYSSEEEQIHNYPKDVKEMSYWLERSARQGNVIAVDNLISCGVGPEVERQKTYGLKLMQK